MLPGTKIWVSSAIRIKGAVILVTKTAETEMCLQFNFFQVSKIHVLSRILCDRHDQSFVKIQLESYLKQITFIFTRLGFFCVSWN